MIKLDKEARQVILKAGRNFEGDTIGLVNEVLRVCGIDEEAERDKPFDEYNNFCDDPDCGACNGIGADGHIW
jgi:hypothetical protein